ncbi:MAG: nuclear transport factor 2 family protein [Dysgonomonas sp.]
MKTFTDITLDYVQAINTGNIEKLYDLMADDHMFIDAHNNKILGKDNMKQSWIDYFTMFPDYKIEVDEILHKDTRICLLGYASGTYKNLRDKNNSNYWRILAAWTAIIRNDRIKQWQVYADNIIVMDIINKNQVNI